MNNTPSSNILTPEYLIKSLPKIINMEKYNLFYSIKYFQKLNAITNLSQLPSKTKEELKTYITYLLSQNLFYINCGNVLLSINSFYKDTKPPNTNYYSLRTWCESTIDKDPSQWQSHIYTFTHNVYLTMLNLKKDQVITLLGSSGSGKSFNVIKILQYLFFISSKSEINKQIYEFTNKAIKLIQLVSNVYIAGNYNSSACGFVYHVGFNNENEISYFDIDSAVLDCTLPFSENGRSFTLLHGFLLTQGEKMGFLKKKFNFFKKYYKNFCNEAPLLIQHQKRDIDNWEMFYEISKEFLTQDEYLKILNVFYIILLCNEVTILKNKKIVNGKKIESYYINKNNITKQISNLLHVDEKKFLDVFLQCSTLQQHKTLLVSIMKYSYLCVHDFILAKIKLKVKSVFTSKCNEKSKNFIHIVDFPGQSKEETLGGLTTNYSYEFLNLYSISNYTSMISSLEQNDIRLNQFEAPLSFEIVKALIGQNGLLTIIDNANMSYNKNNKYINNNSKIKELVSLNDNMPSIIEYLNNNSIVKIGYSFLSVFYSYFDIQMETLTINVPYAMLKLLKSSKNEIYSITSLSVSQNTIASNSLNQMNNNNNNNSAFVDYITNKLKYLLSGLENIEPFVVFCVKKEEIYNNKLKRSIIYNVLDWEWYGYEEWININDFYNEFYKDFEIIRNYLINKEKRVNGIIEQETTEPLYIDNISPDKKRELSKNIILVLSLENECKIGTSFIIMKKGTYNAIKKIFKALIDNITITQQNYNSNLINKQKHSKIIMKAPLKDQKIKKQINSRKNNINILGDKKTIKNKTPNSNKAPPKEESKSEYDISHINTLITINKLSDSLSLIQENNKYGIEYIFGENKLIEHNKNNVILSHYKEYQHLSEFFSNYNNFSNTPYDVDVLTPFIIKIQCHYRVYIIRKKIMKMFIYVKHQVILIQKHIRALLTRIKFYRFLDCLKRIIYIQLCYKLRYEKRLKARVKIQRYFRKKFLNHSVLNVKYPSNRRIIPKSKEEITKTDIINETDKDKLIYYIIFNSKFIQEAPIDNRYYLKQLELKKKKNRRDGEKLEDRLIQYGKDLKLKNIERLSHKEKNELQGYTFHPNINKDFVLVNKSNNFYERNMIFLKEKEDKLQLRKEERDSEFFENFTFKPYIGENNLKRSIDDLFEWQDKINKEKEQKIRKVEEERLREIIENSQGLFNKGQKYQTQKEEMIKEIQKRKKNFKSANENINKSTNKVLSINENESSLEIELITQEDIWPVNIKKLFIIDQ